MTNLVGAVPDTKGDVITTTNNGQGLNDALLPIQDGNGNNSAISLSTEQFQINHGFVANRTAVSTTPYNVLNTDYIIAITANPAGFSVVLPAPTPGLNQIFIIKDEIGSATLHTINVTVSGGANIDDLAIYPMNISYQCLTVYSNGTSYSIISNSYL